MNCLLDCLYSRSEAASPKVNLSLGRLIGRARETSRGTEFVSFTRIPYAKPPTGRFRFKRPLPVESWKTTYKAKKGCSKPVQVHKYLGNTVIGSEDCLHLNVYTPDLPITENQPRLPVMVWLYGGDFYMGDATENLMYPDHLMDSSQVVLVTVNYRVGPMGFLCLGNEEVPGNQALWDQNMALKWVQEHISAFGGDPDRVTLVGEGSGAICVSYHILSPKSAGLFHRAICMSGSFAAPGYHLDKRPDIIGRVYAAKLGCAHTESSETLRRLQEKNANDLVKAGTCFRDWDLFTPRPWVPIVDADYTHDPFLPDHPYNLAAEGHFNKMPVIFGCTKDEGVYYLSAILKDPSLWSQFEHSWPLVTSQILFNRSTDEYKEETDSKNVERLRRFYLEDGMLDGILNQENEDKIIQMFGDAFAFGANEFMWQTMKSMSAQPLYNYSFEYSGTWKFGNLVTISSSNILPRLLLDRMGLKLRNKLGDKVCHGDDHFYLFSSKLPFLKNLLHMEEERRVARRMTKLWTNFARTSNPTPDQDDGLLRNVTWEPDKIEERQYLEITSGLLMRKFDDDQKRRSSLWNTIIKDSKMIKLSGKPPQLHEKTRIEL